MTRSIFFLVLVSGVLFQIIAQDMYAKTDDGRSVLLHSDGTWNFLENKNATDSFSESAGKSIGATAYVTNRFGNVTVWYDPNKWIVEKITNDPSEYQFMALSGESYARLITEKTQLSTNLVRKANETNARRASTIFDVIEEKEVIVNGTKINKLVAKVALEGLYFVFCYYYWTGVTGTVQLFSYTNASLYDSSKNEMIEFMNGLVIN